MRKSLALVLLIPLFIAGILLVPLVVRKGHPTDGPAAPDAPAEVSDLVRALRTERKNEMYSWPTIRALGEMGPRARAAVPALLEARKDRAGSVRQMAAAALIRIDPEAARQAGVEEPIVEITAGIGVEPKDFERDDRVSISSLCHPGGDVLVWVNGDPIGFYTDGGWVRPGTNELTFSGKHRNPIRVMICRREGYFYCGLAGKRIFAGPGGEERAEPLEFSVVRPPQLPLRECLSERPEDRARYEKEIRALIDHLADLIRDHKGEQAARLLWEGGSLWAPTAYGSTAEDIQEILEDKSKRFSDPALKLREPDAPLQFVFGERAVLVYRAMPGEDGRTEYRLFNTNRPAVVVLPLKLARVGGRWIVWGD